MKSLNINLKILSKLTAGIFLLFLSYQTWSTSRRVEITVAAMPSKLVELIADTQARNHLAEWADREYKLISITKAQGSQLLHTRSGLKIKDVEIDKTIFELDKNGNLLQVDFQYGRAGILLANFEPNEYMPYIILKKDNWYVYNQDGAE